MGGGGGAVGTFSRTLRLILQGTGAILGGKQGAAHGLQSGCFLNLATSHYWQMMLLLCEAWQWYPLVEEDRIADPDSQFFEADRLISCNSSWNAFLCGIRTFHHTQSRREAAGGREGGREGGGCARAGEAVGRVTAKAVRSPRGLLEKKRPLLSFFPQTLLTMKKCYNKNILLL